MVINFCGKRGVDKRERRSSEETKSNGLEDKRQFVMFWDKTEVRTLSEMFELRAGAVHTILTKQLNIPKTIVQIDVQGAISHPPFFPNLALFDFASIPTIKKQTKEQNAAWYINSRYLPEISNSTLTTLDSGFKDASSASSSVASI